MYPEEFSFVPKTWVLPQDAQDFKNQFFGPKKTFIVKPAAGC